MVKHYNYKNIRNLLTQGFTDEDLRVICFDEPEFRAVYENWSRGTSKATFVQDLIDRAERRVKLDTILKLAEEQNPEAYKLHQPYYDEPNPSSTASPVPTTPAATPVDVPNQPQQENDIFISYSRRDLGFVTQLYQNLVRKGLSAWFDKESIQVADHWRTIIVEGIRDCKVFVLVLSPDSAASVNVRKEVDLAERYNRKIVPLMWRAAEIPVAMEYQLAGIQWIDFKETASEKNFNDLADVLQRLIGGDSLPEAGSNKSIVVESTVPPLPKAQEESTPAGPRKLGGLKKKSSVSPIVIGGSIISSVVTTFGLDTAEQDFVNSELKWLFYAADNFLKVRGGEVNRSQPIAVPVPDDAQRSPQANNQLLSTVDDFNLQIWEGQIESGFKRIDTHLKNLNILLDHEAKKGDAGKGDVYLQNQIKGARTDIVKVLQEMAQLMNQAYGILVTSPNQLIELLG